MSKPITGKRIRFEVEMYWRGKTRKPSVSLMEADKDGLPDAVCTPEFLDGLRLLCKQLVDAGELD